MDNIAIKAENLSKVYKIGSQKASYRTLRDTLVDTVRAPFNRASSILRGESYGAAGLDQTILALNDVNFEIKQGEVVGVIGANGAGKSTLLKILTRITGPSMGQALIRGRVGSLLEVGTGFHPELTGRENIYLNGSILGMKRDEITGKFDEIVSFSGVEKFLDTPIKHYSSGMQVRLAFSVAAHLEPEILLVDEVLAVGDAVFQKKCLGKMGEVAKTGRTIVFVSHNLPMVQTLCPESILINEGQIVMRGPSSEVVHRYLEDKSNQTGEHIWEWDSANPETIGDLIPIRLSIVDHNDSMTNRVMSKDYFQIEFRYRLFKDMSNLRVGFILKTFAGTTVFLSWDRDGLDHEDLYDRKKGDYLAKCKIPANLLNENRYVLGVNIGIKGEKKYFRDYDILSFSVDATGGVGSHWGVSREGVIRPELNWTTERLGS